MSYDLVRDGLVVMGYEIESIRSLVCEGVEIHGLQDDRALMGGEEIVIEDMFGEEHHYVFAQQEDGSHQFELEYSSEDHDDDFYFPQ